MRQHDHCFLVASNCGFGVHAGRTFPFSVARRLKNAVAAGAVLDGAHMVRFNKRQKNNAECVVHQGEHSKVGHSLADEMMVHTITV